MKRTSTDFEEISTKELFSKLDEDSKVSPNCSARRKPSLEYHVMQKDGNMSFWLVKIEMNYSRTENLPSATCQRF